MDEQLPPGYFLQTTPEGGTWCLYDIREQGDCRICEINAAGDNLEIQVLSGPFDAALEHWNAGVQEQLICTNRIIELLWQQEAPQAVSDQLAAWHREDEAREFASLQGSTTAAAFTAEDQERDFREWVDALNEQRDGEVEISAEERLSGGLDEFYAQEAEMERQLGAEADWKWIWSADAYRLRRLLPNKDSITLRKHLSDDELIEEYDSDYHLTQEERTLELRFERLSIHPAKFLIHAETKPHIPLDLARLLAQIKHGHVSEEDALETFSFLRDRGFRRPDPPRRTTPSFQEYEGPASYAYDPWESSRDDWVDYGYRDDWDYSE
jgi:hypothetical protein